MPRANLVRDGVCPFCDLDLNGKEAIALDRSFVNVDCPVCGRYAISGSACDSVPNWDLSDERRLAIAFAVRRMTDRPDRPQLTTPVLHAIRDSCEAPRPERLLDEAVLWIGKHSSRAGKVVSITYPNSRSILGVWDVYAFNYVTDWMDKSGFFACTRLATSKPWDSPRELFPCSLTPAGWQRYRVLSESHTAGRYGFMAMKYGDSELDSVVKHHFAPEVRKTDFELRRLDEGQGAGLIDDQLRVIIRTSRFMVCDLTHGNRGAYWEAGFAEGLGRPVIYTCRRDVFDNRSDENHPHFDTNHWVTVIWDAADPATAAKRLKDTVRATLPAEARLTDPDVP